MVLSTERITNHVLYLLIASPPERKSLAPARRKPSFSWFSVLLWFWFECVCVLILFECACVLIYFSECVCLSGSSVLIWFEYL